MKKLTEEQVAYIVGGTMMTMAWVFVVYMVGIMASWWEHCQ